MPWDEEIYEIERVKPRSASRILRLIEWHRSNSRKKWVIEHTIAITISGIGMFFFGIAGFVIVIVAFITRELATAVLIEVLVNVVLRKARKAIEAGDTHA